LQGAVIAHHRFDRVRAFGAREPLTFAFLPFNDRNGGLIDGEVLVNVEHAERLFFGLRGCSVGGMPFLPVELRRAQEELCPLLPPQNAVPEVEQHRKVTIGLNPFRVHVADDRLRGGSNREWLRQLFAAAVRYNGELWCESLDVRFFALEK